MRFGSKETGCGNRALFIRDGPIKPGKFMTNEDTKRPYKKSFSACLPHMKCPLFGGCASERPWTSPRNLCQRAVGRTTKAWKARRPTKIMVNRMNLRRRVVLGGPALSVAGRGMGNVPLRGLFFSMVGEFKLAYTNCVCIYAAADGRDNNCEIR